MDAHETLGVSPDATSEEVTQAYRRLARSLHPDVHPGSTPEERERYGVLMARVNHAYRSISSEREARRSGGWKPRDLRGPGRDECSMCGHAPAASVTFTVPGRRAVLPPAVLPPLDAVSRLRSRRRSVAPGPDVAEGLLGPDPVRHQRRRGGRQRTLAPSHHATRAPGARGRGAGAAADAHAARRSGGAARGLLDAPARRGAPGLRRDRLRRARRVGCVADGVVRARRLPRRYRSVRPGALPSPPRRPPGGGRRPHRAVPGVDRRLGGGGTRRAVRASGREAVVKAPRGP